VETDLAGGFYKVSGFLISWAEYCAGCLWPVIFRAVIFSCWGIWMGLALASGFYDSVLVSVPVQPEYCRVLCAKCFEG